MKKVLLTFSLCMILAWPSMAQQPNAELGVRLGGLTSGITFRGFLHNGSAIEGILGFGHRSFIVTGLYEKFKPVGSAPGLSWFYGGGAHIGFFRHGGTYYIYKNEGTHIYAVREGDSKVVPGIDFILGLDYTFNGAPINVGLDMKPFIDFIDGTEFYFDGALSLRFVF